MVTSDCIQLALKRLTPSGGVQKIMTLQKQVLNEHLLSNSQQLTPILTHSNVPKAFIVNRTVKSIERKHQKSFLQLVYSYFFSSSAIRWRPTVHWVYCQSLTHLPPSAAVNWVSIGSGNGLSPVRRQTITWTNANLLSIGLLGRNFSEIWIGILPFPSKKMHLKLFSVKILFRGRWVNV